MRYFYDCEFIEDGTTIDLISIAIVSEDGRELYAVSTEFDPHKARTWVKNHVLPKLPSPNSPLWKSRSDIRDEIYDFLCVDPPVELWAWVGAYDHVALCQLWGSMTELPLLIPRFTHELKQLWEQAGQPPLPEASHAHDALSDARDNASKFRLISALLA